MPAPVNSAAPAITGDAVVGAVLSLSDGTWTGDPIAYAYAWLRDGAAIDGATAASYTVTLADIGASITGRVTATNDDGSTAATSDGVGPVPSTLVVEDGTGLSNADAYLSIADADAYHAAMGNTAWTAVAAAGKEAAIRRATQYLDTRYTWRGEPLTDVQALKWPRDTAAWPVKRVLDACAELALRAAEQGSLYADVSASAIKQESIGPISVTYADPRDGGQVRYAIVDDLLAGLTTGAGRLSMRLERAS